MVPTLLDDLVAYLNSDGHPSVLQAAIAHAQFETIHPFDDGNGRTGRTLIQVVLNARGLTHGAVPISTALSGDIPGYHAALNATGVERPPARSGFSRRGSARMAGDVLSCMRRRRAARIISSAVGGSDGRPVANEHVVTDHLDALHDTRRRAASPAGSPPNSGITITGITITIRSVRLLRSEI